MNNICQVDSQYELDNNLSKNYLQLLHYLRDLER